MSNQTESPHEPVPALVAGLRSYFASERASYHMPGHKQRVGSGIHPLSLEVFGAQTIVSDVSEMGGFDYLHAPEGALIQAQSNAAAIFGADHTFFLVNGSTVGNLAVIFALSGQGDRVLMLRGSHRSVYSGTVLSGAIPSYLPMSYHEPEDGWFVVDHDKIDTHDQNQEGRLAVIHITRPNYYGMACDLKPYVELAHRTGAILVVDEAHGAHFGLVDGVPRSALQEGADIVIQSTHKTLGALGQGSMLHIKGERAKEKLPLIARALQMLQSSSPSALLEISLDLSASYMDGEGKNILASTVALAKQTRKRIAAIQGLRVLGEDSMINHVIKQIDPTKIVIDVSGTGRSGFAASLWLRTNTRIWIELADFRRIVASLTLGDDQASADLLVDALTQMATVPGEGVPARAPLLPGPPPAALPPRVALQAEAVSVPLSEVQNRICAEYVIPYPPGIPLVAPGETLTAEILAALASFRESGSRIVGPIDGSLATLRCVVEK